MKKINIIQFMPYFPPHKWWVENVWQEIWIYWIKNNLWNFINIVTDFEQDLFLNDRNYEKIIFENEVIGYKINNSIHLVIPSFEIINNFPIYKFWDKKTNLIFNYLKLYLKENKNIRIITHTRFFTTSLIWWIFAIKNKLKWIHIEHWSDYVKLSSKIKTKLSILYDRIIWKWILKKSDLVLSISNASKKFILNNFINREIFTFYRWIDFSNIKIEKSWDLKLIYVWRLVNLKWVSDLIESYKELGINNELVIIWDWEEKNNLKEKSKWLNIKFLGYKNKDFIINYLSLNNFILINPSYQEWMPTTVIEALSTWNPVIASDVWWTKEISNKKDLILFKAWNRKELSEKILYWIENYNWLKWLSFDLINKRFKRDKNILKLYNLFK